MNRTPWKKNGLPVSLIAMVARRQLESGATRNHLEVMTLITDFVVEDARISGSVAGMMEVSGKVLTCDRVISGVAEIIHSAQREARFPNGASLVTTHELIR